MATSPDESLRNILGLNKDTTAAKIATFGLGGIVGGGLALSWLQNQGTDNTLNRIFGIKSTASILNKATANIQGTTAELNNDLAKIGTDTTGAIKAKEAEVKTQISDSAKARGLNSEVANAAQQQYGGSLSGAYATAARALAQAKANVRATTGRAMSSYYQGLAESQFKDMVQRQAERAGILGQIGGLTGAIIKQSMTKTPDIEIPETKTQSPTQQQVYSQLPPTGIPALDTELNPIQIPMRTEA